MSEDLDFSVTNELCIDRKSRRILADALRDIIPGLLAEAGLREVSAFKGFNESRQYNAVFGYDSVAASQDIIKFEVGFRGELMLEPEVAALKTLMQKTFSNEPYFSPFSALVLSKNEAYAEKVRAALSRKTPAIRDFYDLEAILESGFDLCDLDFLTLVQRKLRVSEDNQVNLTKSKELFLSGRIASELAGVLQADVIFSLEKSWKILEKIVQMLPD